MKYGQMRDDSSFLSSFKCTQIDYYVEVSSKKLSLNFNLFVKEEDGACA